MATYEDATRVWQTPGGHPALLAYRVDTVDWNVVSSCLDSDEYGLRGRALSGVAVDVGAYIGPVTVALALDNPDLRVIAIEPVPDNVRLLRQNIAEAGVGDRVEVIEGAVGDGKPITIDHGYTGSETSEHHAFIGNLHYDGDDRPHESTTLDSVTLKAVVKQAGGSIDFMKVDCEGGEYAFLRGPALRSVGTIIGEAHAGPYGMPATLFEQLEKTHDVTITMGTADAICHFSAVRK